MTDEWSWGQPVNTDSTNFEWSWGQPYIITEPSGGTYPYTLAVEFVTDHMHLTWSEP